MLSCLAVADHPLTPLEVQVALGGDLAYTTVMTTLARLHDKRALTRKLDGRAYRYCAAGDASEVMATVIAHRMLQLLSGADRAEVLSRFVADLEPGDELVLARLLHKSPRPIDSAHEAS